MISKLYDSIPVISKEVPIPLINVEFWNFLKVFHAIPNAASAKEILFT